MKAKVTFCASLLTRVCTKAQLQFLVWQFKYGTMQEGLCQAMSEILFQHSCLVQDMSLSDDTNHHGRDDVE